MPIRPATLIAPALAAIALAFPACGKGKGSQIEATAAELSGRGYVHYHLYPDTGQCYCGVEYPFTVHAKMIAAASESIHSHFGEAMCSQRRFATLTSQKTGKSIRVLIVDKGGQPTDDFRREEQHIMDISEEAFDALDADGSGKPAGRIYVDWEIEKPR